MDWIKRIYLFSTSILIILAIFGYHLAGIHLFGLHIFPFIIYLITFHAIISFIFIFKSDSIINISKLDILVLLFAGLMSISVLWASDTVAALVRLGIILPSIAIALLISVTVKSEHEIYYYINIIKLFVSAIAFFAIIAAVLDLSILDIHWFDTERYSRGWYTNRNDFSYFLSVISPLFLFSVVNSRLSVSRRIIEFVIFVTLTTVILFNGSRAVIGGHSIVVILCMLFIVVNSKRSFRNYTHRILHSVNRVFTIGWLLTIPILALLFKHIQNPFTTEQNSLYIRWNLHVGAYDLAFSNLLGVGIGGFSTAYDQLGLYPGSVNPHSWFGQILAELGLIGIVLFLIMYGSLLDLLFNKSDQDILIIALFASLVSFAVSGLAPSEVLRYQIHWILIGISIGYLKVVE